MQRIPLGLTKLQLQLQLQLLLLRFPALAESGQSVSLTVGPVTEFSRPLSALHLMIDDC